MLSSQHDKELCQKRLSWDGTSYFNRRLASNMGQSRSHLDMQSRLDIKPTSGISVGYWKAIRFTAGELHLHKKRKTQLRKTHKTRIACSADTNNSQDNPNVQMQGANSSKLDKRISTIGFLLKKDIPVLSHSFKGMDSKSKRYTTDLRMCKCCLSTCCRRHTSNLDDFYPKPEAIYRERTFDSQIAIARSRARSSTSHEAQMKRVKCKAASVRRFTLPTERVHEETQILPLKSAPAYYDPMNIRTTTEPYSPRISQISNDKYVESTQDRTKQRDVRMISDSRSQSSEKKSDSRNRRVRNNPDSRIPRSNDNNLPSIGKSKEKTSKLSESRQGPRNFKSKRCWGYRSPRSVGSASPLTDEDYMAEVYANLKKY